MDKPKIRTSQDLLRIPNYLVSVDPNVQPLSHIVTHYYLDHEFPCGLKNCRQPHKDGFLVELEDGNVSNVGHICGQQFGEKFAAEQRRYAEHEIRPNAIHNIQEVIPKIQGMRQDLDRLASEADRLSRCKQGMRSQFPSLYRELERRAHGGNDRVAEQIERSKEELGNLEAMNPGVNRERFRYREESRGVLSGLRILAMTVREEVVTKFTGKAEELLSTNVAALSTDNLLEWEGWALRFDETIHAAHGVVAAGNAFFAPECFRLMGYIATVHREKAALSKLTVAKLLKDVQGSDRATTTRGEPIALSKKQRDLHKKLKAIQRKAGRSDRY